MVLPSSVYFSPFMMARTAATVSRVRVWVFAYGTPIQFCTMLGVEMPSPSTKRPPESWLTVAADIAISGAGRVNTGTIAVPKRNLSESIAAAAIGENASLPNDSNDHPSV